MMTSDYGSKAKSRLDGLIQTTLLAASSAHYAFDEGDELPDEYRALLMKMLRHEGERAGNKSFLGLVGTCLELAENQAPTAEARLLKAEYVAEELKHAI